MSAGLGGCTEFGQSELNQFEVELLFSCRSLVSRSRTMLNLFSPHGSNPLGNVKLSNPRNARVDFDRGVKANVLTLDGDLTASRLQLPKEDRAGASLQLIHPLLCLQIWIPPSGQFLLELSVSHSTSVHMKLSCGTHVSKPDVTDVKGVAHVKLPLAIPRSSWTQVVFHVPGIFSHLFGLPAVRWVDTVTVAGCVKVKRILVTSEEQLALESRPPGMLLYTLPAYGPPLWSGRCGVAQPEQKPEARDEPIRTESSFTPKDSEDNIKMRFVRGEDGRIAFSATSAELEEAKRREREREEWEVQRKFLEEAEEDRRRKREEELKLIQEDRRDYVRLLDTPTNPAPNQPYRSRQVKLVKPPMSEAVKSDALFSGDEVLPMGWDSDDDSLLKRETPPSEPKQQAKQSAVRLSRIQAPAKVAAPPSKRKPSKLKVVSLVQLSLPEPAPTHPADSYAPRAKGDRVVGYGVGCLEVIHDGDEEPPTPARSLDQFRRYDARRVVVQENSVEDE